MFTLTTLSLQHVPLFNGQVVSVVKSLSTMGITVAATIHSPSSFCFQLFDQLLLLVRGRVVFFGTNGKAVVDYFNNICSGNLPRLKTGAH
jgi:ABC-type multidrug transport system ATPase subunit